MAQRLRIHEWVGHGDRGGIGYIGCELFRKRLIFEVTNSIAVTMLSLLLYPTAPVPQAGAVGDALVVADPGPMHLAVRHGDQRAARQVRLSEVARDLCITVQAGIVAGTVPKDPIAERLQEERKEVDSGQRPERFSDNTCCLCRVFLDSNPWRRAKHCLFEVFAGGR